jgi:hypothetical protein
MIVDGVFMQVSTLNPFLLRTLNFDVEVSKPKEEIKALRKLRTRTAVLRSYAYLTKAEGTYELTFPLIENVFKNLICPIYDDTNAVYVPDDGHNAGDYTFVYGYRVFEKNQIYYVPDGVIDELTIDIPIDTFPSMKITSYHYNYPTATTDTLPDESTASTQLLPHNFVVGYAVYTGDTIGSFVELPTNHTTIEINQNIEPKIGNTNIVDDFVSNELNVSVSLTVVDDGTIKQAYLDGNDIAVQVQYYENSTLLFTITFPKFSIYKFDEYGNYKLIKMELRPNALSHYPIQIAF